MPLLRNAENEIIEQLAAAVSDRHHDVLVYVGAVSDRHLRLKAVSDRKYYLFGFMPQLLFVRGHKQ